MRGQLFSEIWSNADDVESRSVDSRTVENHIRRLGKKLGPESDRLETVIGLGYRLRTS
ncbi:MAG: helix-turn-helix domain-containing protein [Deltaproteobacteria bacterium]|nr:helix-turn-helix domain-containing protein [Deltaproteobacteria bacterium]